MAAVHVIRFFRRLLDVDDTGIAHGDVPTFDTLSSKFTMAPPGAASGHSVTLDGNTAGVLALISTGTWTLAGGPNVTLSQAGNAVTISGAAGGGGTQTAISGISASDTLYTSGTVRLSGVGGGITVSSNTGQRIDLSVAAPVAQSVQTQNVIDLTLDGNTAGVLALLSSGTATLAGGNNITLSQVGNAITISGADAAGAQTAISGLANSETTYTSGTVSLSELGAITIRSTTGNQFQISVNPQSVQPETQTFVGGISASDTLYTSGSVRITGVGGGITVSTNTGQRIDLSVAAQSVQPETQTFVAGIQNSQTTYTSGTVNLSVVAGNLTIRSTTGQAFQFSASQTNQAGSVFAASNTSGTSSGTYDARTLSIAGAGMVTVAASNSGWRIDATQSVQTQNLVDVTLAGNSTSAGAGFALVSSGTLTLAGGNNVTLSQNGNAVTISAASQSVQAETQTFIGGIRNSETTYTSGTVNLSVVGGALTIRSTTGNAFQFSASQSVQAETQTAISGIANSQTTYTSGTVSLSELGAITIRSTTGNQFQLSVNAQTVQTQGILSAGVSTGGNTAGNTTVNTGSRMVLVGTGDISLSQATAAGATTISISGSQSVQTNDIPRLGVSTGGNTSGDTTVNSGTRFVLVGSNNITLSQGTAANATTITISGPTTVAQTNQSGNVYASSNTFGTSSGTYDARSISIAGRGAVSVAASNSGWIISAPAQSVQVETQTFVGGIANSQTTYTSGTVSLSELGAVTVRSTTGNQFQISVNSQTVQTQNLIDVTLSGNSTSAGAGYILMSSGTLTLAGGNNVTLSQNGNAVTISAGGGAETQTAISGIANSQTTYTSGTVSLSELGAITIRSTTGNQFQLSVNSQTVQTQGILAVGASTGGNTAGDTGVASGTRLVLVGSNGITVSQGTAANATTLTLSGVTQSVQTQGGFASMGVSTGGNTAGNTQVSTGSRFVLVGTNMISLSQATAAGASTITLDATNQNLSIGASTGGNTAGNTTVNTGSRLVLVGSNNITVSQGTAAGATTLTISGPATSAQQTGISAISNSNTTFTSGTIGISELGAITIRSTTGNQFQFSVNSQTAQTGLSAVSNSNTTYTSGTFGLSELGAITIRSTTGQQFQFSVNSQTVQTQGIPLLGVSTGGNTAGDTTVNSGTRLVLAGGNNITLSQSTAANATTITISAPNLGAGAFSGGASNLGNTAGSTGITGTRLILVGTNNISLSQSTDANGGTLSINNTVSAFQAGMSTDGNTAGDTGVTGTRMVFVGSSPLSLSQATGANGATLSIRGPATSSLSATGQVSISTNASTISIGVPNPLHSYRWIESPLQMGATQGIGTSGATNTTISAWVMPVTIPTDLAFNNIALAAHVSFSSATTSISSINYSFSMGASLGFYSLTGSSMSLVTSFSGSLGYSNATAANVTNMSLTARVGMGGSSTTKSTQGGANMTAIMSSINSVRAIPLNWTTISHTLTRGQYWAVAGFSALTGGANHASLSQVGFVSNYSAIGSALNPPDLMQNTASVTSPYPFLGMATLVASTDSLMPVSFNTSKITTATAIANSTAFQSLWLRVYSSHSN